MPDCIVSGCNSRSTQVRKTKNQLELEKTVHITFHKLPSNEEKRKIWIDKLQLHQSKLYKGCRVCSLHFKEEMFDKTSACGRVRLKENAIPLSKETVLVSTKETTDKTVSVTLSSVTRKRILVDVTDENDPKRRIISNSPLTIEQNSKEIVEPKTPPKVFNYVDCATSVSPILSENTPRKVFLRKALQTQKKLFSKKICTLQQAKRRKDQQISQMQQIISELKKKNFVSCEELQVLDDLGCSFELQSFQTYFQHPVSADKVVVFLDACHDLKLVRNALADLKVLIDHDGNLIEWKYFLLLEELQRHEGLHLGNKLKNNHVNYRNQKMKVKLAAQLFSRSVADALQLCESDLKLPAFKHAAATIKFIQIINDLFDILNSKNIKQPGLKSAIHSANFATIQEVLNNGFDYIKKLQLTNGQLIVTSPRKTGFLGFLICISSIQYLYQSLCQDKTILLCIPAYKFSQDHLELLFGCIRYHGGCNNNPTARQLEIIFKKLLVHAEVKESATGNCVPFQNVNILHVSSNSEKIINITTPHAHMVDIADVESVITDHSYLPNMEITELSERIIVYIAGFVVRHLKKKILCEDCLDALISDNMFLHSSMISIKNRGKLIYPSKSVVTICRKCEVVIRRALRESGGKKLLKKFSPIYLLNMVLNNLLPSTSLFQELDDHCNNQTDYSNHCAHLIRATANKYITIRLYYIGSTVNQNNSERQKLNKLILFKGQ